MISARNTESTDTFGDMVKTVEGLNLEIIQGEVFMVYPGLGVYLVLPKHGDASGSLVACCSVGGSIGRSGVQGGDTYEAGDDVLVAIQRNSVNISLNSKALSDIGYILAAAPPDFMASAQGNPGANIHGESLDYFSQTVTDAFTNTKKLANTLRDISYGMPNDVFAGDFVKYGPLFTFLSVCATKTTMGASPMAMVETFAFHDKVRTTARTLEDRSTSTESGREPDTDSMMYYERLALREREGMGAIGTVAPFKQDASTGEITMTEEGQLGVFRHTRLAGEMGDGDLDALLKPTEEDAVHTVEKDSPVGKVSVRKTYDGRHETRAAGGIDHVKTIYIPVPEQTAPHDENTSAETDPQIPYDEENRDGLGGAFSPFAGTLAPAEFDYDTVNFRNMRVPFREDYWKLMTREELAEVYPTLDVENAPKNLEGLGPDKPFYDEPPYVEEKDPVTELNRRLYALESIIRQQPDGSIAISDGHGSEILMHRGRISISPAADLELRPGRDCIELVPRRKVINAGEELQLVSNEGKVRIKADTNVDILAGNSGAGRLLLENRGAGGVAEDSGGVVVRSEADLRMVGNDVYLGVAPPQGTPSDSGLSRNRVGSVIIDSRGGSLGLHGSKLYGRFENGVSLSSGNALMSVAQGIFTVISNMAQFATGPFTIGRIEEGSVQQVVLDEHGVSEETVQSAGNSYLQIAGGLSADGAIFKGTVSAANVNATSAAFGNASDESGLFAEDIKPPEFQVDPFSVAYLGILSSSYAASVPADLTDKQIQDAWFQYDQADDVDQSEFLMHEMRWQAMLGASGGGSAWQQTAVKDSDGDNTYAYPGYGPDGDVIQDSEFAKKPLNEYIVNR